MLNMLAKLLAVLNSDRAPNQVSFAFVLAMIVGLTPVVSPHNLICLFLLLVVRAHLASFLLAFAFFSGIAYLLDPIFDGLGYQLLSASSLQNLWNSLYSSAVWRFTHFNNTILLGSLFVSMCSALPMFAISQFMIKKYRQSFLVWVKKTKVVQVLKGNQLYRLIVKATEVRDAL